MFCRAAIGSFECLGLYSVYLPPSLHHSAARWVQPERPQIKLVEPPRRVMYISMSTASLQGPGTSGSWLLASGASLCHSDERVEK